METTGPFAFTKGSHSSDVGTARTRPRDIPVNIFNNKIVNSPMSKTQRHNFGQLSSERRKGPATSGTTPEAGLNFGFAGLNNTQ